ncbi:hypothetical protein [Salinibacter altiplanensis]|uniref:hypothetical protein n=1 Tax=Salinibacter altiplanensis TaxID=1803181 RepID=UPI000C9FE861|nr:hypothetical protein [Salinibacter altiplanensis]
MNDSWIGPLGALLLVGCCLLLETGLVGSGIAVAFAGLGYRTLALAIGGGTLAIVGAGWWYRRHQAPEHAAGGGE